MESLKKRFASIPLEESLSIDKQLLWSTKARKFFNLPTNPHKWGYKLFVLCNIFGFSYNFKMHSSQENNDDKRYSWEPDFGDSGNVVVRLCKIFQKNMNFKVYYDNYSVCTIYSVYEKPSNMFFGNG